LASVKYDDINTSQSSIRSTAFGTHYFSYHGIGSAAASVYGLEYLNIPATGTGTPQGGVYETQTQLFSKRINVPQIRVYCEPAVSGNSFQLDLIGSDGNVLNNGTFTYTFGDITDPQSGSTAVERINFNCNPKTQYALGLRLTNIGSTNMTIKKVEVDYNEEGK
jgi:hypothetical protein